MLTYSYRLGRTPLDVFTFISQVFVPLQFILSNARQIKLFCSYKSYSRHFQIIKLTTKNAFLQSETVIQVINVEGRQPETEILNKINKIFVIAAYFVSMESKVVLRAWVSLSAFSLEAIDIVVEINPQISLITQNGEKT